MSKVRRTLNISLQSKKYLDPINKIVQEWESNGLNISTETCEALLIANKMTNYNTIKKILDVCNLLENIIDIRMIEGVNIDKYLSDIILIDNHKLSEIIMELNDCKIGESNELNKDEIKREIKGNEVDVRKNNNNFKKIEVAVEEIKEVEIGEEKKEEIREKSISDSDFGIVFNV